MTAKVLKMSIKVNVGRSFLLRVDHDSDIIDFLTKFAQKNDITTATFSAIGALKSAKLGFYNQEDHQYSEISLPTPQEVACCIGNISLKDGTQFTHAHAVLVDLAGEVHGGHLIEGRVFAIEVTLFELLGPNLIRKYDTATGLSLWNMRP